MALTINTNISSLTAQRNLDQNQISLDTALQRLSSGLRINSAADDAAGLAISDGMTSQINGLNQAVQNSNDAIALAQTGEGALGQATNILQRIRELAVESANGTNSATDRQQSQKEVGQLLSQLQDIATSTQYNGKTLFDGSFGTANFQVGANANQTISTTMGNFKTDNYGTYEATGHTYFTGAPSTGALTINGSIGTGTVNVTSTDSAATVAAAINAGDTGVTASAETVANLSSLTGGGAFSFAVNGDNATAVDVSFSVSTSSSDELSSAVSAFNDVSGQTGITAAENSTGTGIILTDANGNDITVNANSSSVANSTAAKIAAGTSASGAANLKSSGSNAVHGQITLDSSSSYSVSETGTAGYFASSGAAVTLQAVDSIDVSTAAGATEAMKIVDGALSSLDDQQANLGALQNRLQDTVSNLQNMSENLTSARSGIMDADFASETAAMTKGQVLEQSGIAVLAQANQLPQYVLSLLK